MNSYHGGSLNGKDIKKVMKNACHILDLCWIFLKGEEAKLCAVGCQYQYFVPAVLRGVSFVRRGIFISEDNQSNGSRHKNLRLCVDAAVKDSKDLQCTITPKVHPMLEHIKWQIRNIQGGLGDKMNDWVEHLHQTGKRQHLCYHTVQKLIARSLTREKRNFCNMHPDVIAQTEKRQREQGISGRVQFWPCGDAAKKAAWYGVFQVDAIFDAGCHQETHLVSPIIQRWEGRFVRQQECQKFCVIL